MTAFIFILSAVLFGIAYLTYGRIFLQRAFDVDGQLKTPSHEQYDGVDYVPSRPSILLGHHFSSIAGAGPIVGPIIAVVAFGWLPALVWILLGSIFIGGVHDFSAIMASIRHKGRSIAEIASIYMSPLSYRLMLIFIWLTLSYVLVVFLDLTASTFTQSGGVASSSILYIALALVFGLTIYKLKVPILYSSLVFVPLVFVGIWLGQIFPASLPFLGSHAQMGWDAVLLLYCFIASVTPVWILLQPRDYLASYLLYAAVLVGTIGMLFGGLPAKYPAFVTWNDPHLGPLFPLLFITIACGAVSGFHSIVGSGTTSKQLDKEQDAVKIGYGAMLLEGIVAVIAVTTVLIVAPGHAGGSPVQVFGRGIARFFEVIHLPAHMGEQFGMLAISTFLLTTLDTCTRLTRYIFQEFFSLKNEGARYWATIVSLVMPTLLVAVKIKDPVTHEAIPVWKAIWPIFGVTNQMLAVLALTVAAVWMIKKGRKVWFILIPAVFMIVITLWSLVLFMFNSRMSNLARWFAGGLFVLAILLCGEGMRTFIKPRSPRLLETS